MSEMVHCCACGLVIGDHELQTRDHESGKFVHETLKCTNLLSKKRAESGEPASLQKIESKAEYRPKYKGNPDLHLVGSAFVNPYSRVLSWQSPAGLRSMVLTRVDIGLLLSAFMSSRSKKIKSHDGLVLSPNINDIAEHSISSGLVTLKTTNSGDILVCLGKANSQSYSQFPLLRPRFFVDTLRKVQEISAQKDKPRRIIRR